MNYQERLKWAIERAGYDSDGGQAKLAREVGVTSASIGQLRSGETKFPKADNSAKLARVLCVDHYWLATGEGEPVTPLMTERLALSAKAVYIGERFDAIEDPAKRDQAYAIIVQLLDFRSGDGLR